ncbi:MAG: 3'-5' exonuclease [Azoarcus sp.]|nr:3'-5' exonuclease [Azoarcus sp.]
MIYSHVMIDLETMGQTPDAAIVAIGAVAFDLTSCTISPDAYYQRITLASAMAAGGTVDAGTILWWMQQSVDARAEITRTAGQTDLAPALLLLREWFAEFADPEAEVWGCGSDFDNVILASAYRNTGIEQPWKWWRNRCYRTLKSMHRDIQFERMGTHHNAVADAESQALHLIRIMNPHLALAPANFAYPFTENREAAQ